MTTQTRCLTCGLSAEDIRTCTTAFHVSHPTAPPLDVIPITDALWGRRVRDVLAEEAASASAATDPVVATQRFVLIHTEDRELVLPLLRSFKSVLPDPQTVAFALVTETALDWTFAEYLDHLAQEHRHFQTNRPEADPDMKRL